MNKEVAIATEVVVARDKCGAFVDPESEQAICKSISLNYSFSRLNLT